LLAIFFNPIPLLLQNCGFENQNVFTQLGYLIYLKPLQLLGFLNISKKCQTNTGVIRPGLASGWY
jgi:hypothetical protein